MALSVPDVNVPLFGSDSHRKPELEQLILEKYAASFAHIVYVTHKQYGPQSNHGHNCHLGINSVLNLNI